MASYVTYHAEQNIGVVTLNRPDKLNAINPAVKAQIVSAFAEAEADEATAVVILEAAGRAFCVGFDIGGTPRAQGAEEGPNRWDPALHSSLKMQMVPWSLSKPVIASVHGYVLGGGCELAMMCDLTIAADDAQFGEPEVRFSHIGPVMMMPWIIGLKRAREMILFGDMIDADTARDWGMVNRVVPREKLRDTTRTYAKRLALIAPEALRWGKRTINRGAEIAGLQAALQAGVDAMVALYATRTAVNSEFDRRVKEDGLKAALAWRRAQFDALDIDDAASTAN